MSLSNDLLIQLLQMNTDLPGEFSVVEPEAEHVPNTSLAMVEAMMKTAEQQKYPARMFAVEELHVSYENKQPLKIKYINRTEKPFTDKALEDITLASIKIRKLNIIAGTLYALRHSPSYLHLDAEEKSAVEHDLLTLAVKIDTDPTHSTESPRRQLEPVIEEMIAIIQQKSPLDKQAILRSIRNAERYYIADSTTDTAIINDSVFSGDRYFQIDVPFNRVSSLTDKQKKNFLLIHDADKNKHPSWFRELPAWEQECLRNLVPETMEGDWSKLAQSSNMMHIPGLKNARFNALVKMVNDHPEILSKSVKCSTFVPFEMAEQSRTIETDKNAEQMLDALQKQAKDNFEQIWGRSASQAGVKNIVLIQSLLSDVPFSSEDTKMTALQKAALHKAEKDGKYASTHINAGNDPVNVLKILAWQGKERWEYANEMIDYAQDFLSKVKANTDEQTLRKKYIQNLVNELQAMQGSLPASLHGSPLIGRNYEEFKVAYLSLLVEALGGAVSTNCKSGKDRTGLDELYRHAMRIYYQKYDRLPRITDKGEDRENFIRIYSHLFDTRKAQEAAAMNTPASFGLKDLPKAVAKAGLDMMLCADIVEALGASYNNSNMLAGMNKPASFTHDESVQKKEMQAKSSTIPKKSGKSSFFAHDHEPLKDRVETNFEQGKYDVYAKYANQGIMQAEEALDLAVTVVIQHENEKIIRDLHEYIREYPDSPRIKVAEDFITQFTLYNSRISAISEKLSTPETHYFLNKPDVLATNNEDEAIRYAEQLLKQPIDSVNHVSSINEEKTSADPVEERETKYLVVPIKYDNIESVTISSSTTNGLSSKIYFSAANPPNPPRQQSNKGFFNNIPGVKKTTIPNEDLMNWARDNVDIFLLDSKKKNPTLRSRNMSKEQAEAIEIYCRYYSSLHRDNPVKCITHYKIEEESLERKVGIYREIQEAKNPLMPDAMAPKLN